MQTRDGSDPTAHRNQTRALPNDRYHGPILAGQRWQGRGTSNHNRALYTVLRWNGRSVKVVQEGNKHGGGKPFNVPEASWRGNFNLVSQPPGVHASDLEQIAKEQEALLARGMALAAVIPVEMEGPPADPIGDAIAETRPPAPPPPGRISRKTEVTMLSPITREEAEELITVLEQNHREQEQAVLNPTLPAEPAPEPEPAEPEPTPTEPEPAPRTIHVEGSSTDPMAAWIEGGRQMVEVLTQEIASVDAKRSALEEQITALRTQLALIQTQRDTIEAAVLHAIELSERPRTPSLNAEEPPAERWPALASELPPAPVPEAVLDKRRQALERPRTADGARFTPAPGKLSQREWVLRHFRESPIVKVADIRDAFATEYGLTADAATKNVSSILGYQLKDRKADFPAIARLGAGVYQRVGPA